MAKKQSEKFPFYENGLLLATASLLLLEILSEYFFVVAPRLAEN